MLRFRKTPMLLCAVVLMMAAALFCCVGALAEGGAAVSSPSPEPHFHRWTYTVQGSAIVARCDGPGTCDARGNLVLAIAAPTALVYDGTPKGASLNADYSRDAFGDDPRVTYVYGGNTLTNITPVDAETYTARVEPRTEAARGVRASVTYTVYKADQFITQLPEPLEVDYDGKEHPLVTPPEALPEGCAGLLYSLDEGRHWSEELPVGVEATAYAVTVRYAGDHNHNDFDTEPLASVIAQVPHGLVIATLTAQGEDAVKVTWTPAEYVDGYDVFLKRCDDKGKYTVTATVEGAESTETTVKGLKKYTHYKGGVRAWVMKGSEKRYVLDASPVVYIITGDYARGTVNPGSLKLSHANVTLKIDRTLRVGGTVKGVKKGNLLSHVARLRYLSSDTGVAVVNNKGDVTSVGPGACLIYAITNNGLWKSINVTVDPEPDTVWFEQKRGTMKVGSTVDLGALVKLWPGRSQTTLTWESSNAEVASVDEAGVVKALKKGEVTVTVTASNGKRARVKIKVKQSK